MKTQGPLTCALRSQCRIVCCRYRRICFADMHINTKANRRIVSFPSTCDDEEQLYNIINIGYLMCAHENLLRQLI